MRITWMRKIFIICLTSLILSIGFSHRAPASENTNIIYTAEPMFRYVFVDGDQEKFREDSWIKDRAAGGLNEFSLKRESNDLKLEMEGRAVVDENDYILDLNMVKEGIFTLKTGFKEFRKYYDGTGGYYSRFSTRPYIELDRDLGLNDKHFFIDFVYKKPDSNAYFINYEQHAKNGTISLLSWNTITESVSGTSTGRKIAPTFKEIDEIQHTVKFGAEGDKKLLTKDVHWLLEERLIYFNEESTREERKYGDGSGTKGTLASRLAFQNALDRQEELPKTKLHSTTLLADSHINDWLFVSTTADYEHSHASSWETLTERNSTTDVITQFESYTENFFGATSINDTDRYGWGASFFVAPLKYLTATAHLKAELYKRSSSSIYPRDTGVGGTGAIDGIIDNTIYSDTGRDDKSFGETLSIRFTKLPRTVLYIDGEFEQLDGRLIEDRLDTKAGSTETFRRDTDIDTYRNSIITGMNWYPCSFLNISAQYRKNLNSDNYDDREETVGTGSAFSAFVDKEIFAGDVFTTKVNIKPCKWLHGMLKYQLHNNTIYTTIEAQGEAKATHDVHTYLATITLIPRHDLYLSGMFSRQTDLSNTVASLGATAQIPAYEANVNTIITSATYVINPKASLEVQYHWVRSDNFNDYSATGMPYGLDNRLHGLWTSFKYDLKDNLSTELNYGYSSYDEDSNNGVDDYKAHLIGGRIKYVF